MSDLGKRFREKLSYYLLAMYGAGLHNGEERSMQPSEYVSDTLNHILSTKLDGRYVLALIDTKEEDPLCSMKSQMPAVQETVKIMLKEGYKKVVHVFGEDRDE